MPSAIFVTTMGAVTPNLPFDGLYESGGHSCIGEVPGKVGTIMVRVWADDALLDAMAESLDVVYLEDVAEPTEGPEKAGAKPVKRAFNRGKLLQYLLAKGHAASIATSFPGAVKDAIAATWAAHGVTAQQWREACIVTMPAEKPTEPQGVRIVHDTQEPDRSVKLTLPVKERRPAKAAKAAAPKKKRGRA